MKKSLILSAVFLGLILTSCNINDPDFYHDYDPPSAPEGVIALNGDERVDITWFHNNERDLSGYNIYYSYEYDGEYTLIGSTSDNYFIDDEAVNGETYFYAVAAFDYNGNESELSYEEAYASPRPEGYNQTIFDYINFPDNSGYSFDEYLIVPFDDMETDFFFENYEGTYYLDVYDDTDIRDMGPTNDIFDIEFAPVNGWSDTKDAIAIPGHTYVIWTWDNHFAKIRVKSITRDRVTFDWAYQLIEGNTMLKPKNVPEKRNPLNRDKKR